MGLAPKRAETDLILSRTKCAVFVVMLDLVAEVRRSRTQPDSPGRLPPEVCVDWTKTRPRACDGVFLPERRVAQRWGATRAPAQGPWWGWGRVSAPPLDAASDHGPKAINPNPARASTLP